MILNKKQFSNAHLFIHQKPKRKNKWNGEVSILIQDDTTTTGIGDDDLQHQLDTNHKIGMEND